MTYMVFEQNHSHPKYSDTLTLPSCSKLCLLQMLINDKLVNSVVAKVFSNTLIFLLQKCEKCKSYSHFFSQQKHKKTAMNLPYFKIDIPTSH